MRQSKVTTNAARLLWQLTWKSWYTRSPSSLHSRETVCAHGLCQSGSQQLPARRRRHQPPPPQLPSPSLEAGQLALDQGARWLWGSEHQAGRRSMRPAGTVIVLLPARRHSGSVWGAGGDVALAGDSWRGLSPGPARLPSGRAAAESKEDGDAACSPEPSILTHTGQCGTAAAVYLTITF